MKFRTWFNLAALCTTLALTGCGGDHSKDKASADPQGGKTYIVGSNAEFAPFESHANGGEITGFDIDLIKAMAKSGGFKVTFKDQPWDSLFASLNNGDLDAVVSAVTITDERKQSMDFTEPYFNITQVVLMPTNKTPIQSVNDLKNLNRIGVISGQTSDFAAQKILGAQSTKIARFDTAPLVLKELENGGVDAVIADSAVIDNYVKNNKNKSFNIIKVPDFKTENYAIALRKGDAQTQQIFNDALKTIQNNGEYQRIYNQYFDQK